ncbi:MAG: XRE family transcriptional regulator [Phyllobacterium sp.]|uniref:helix-turn-helix domain-containing protein n=1 Tax=Phyllobacterium sp. TaxID=1871046 RepID=UPI0030F1EF0A
MTLKSSFLVAVGSQDRSSEQIGVKLRRLRADRELTIAQLAEQAGVSAGIISQIERGKSNPSIKTLQRIRAALGVNLWEFLEGNWTSADQTPQVAPESRFIRRKADRTRIVVGVSRLAKELLSPSSDRNLRFMIITLPPGGESEDVIIGEGEKGGLVTQGHVELSIGPDVFDLHEGDSCQFPSSLPHKICNRTQETAVIIWIISVLNSHI